MAAQVCYYIIIILFLVPMAISLNKLKGIDKIKYVTWVVPTFLVQFLIIILGTVLNGKFLIMNESYFYWFLIIIFIVILIEMILTFYILLIDLTKISIKKEWNKLSGKKKIIYLVSVVIFLTLIPHFLFSIIYLFSYGIYDLDFLVDKDISYFDFLYLSFAMYFSLSIKEGSNLSIIQEQFSIVGYLRVVQVIHIVFNKLLEFVLIGYFVSKASDVITGFSKNKKSKKSPTVASELKELFQLKQSNAITDQEYIKLKKDLIE